MFEFDSAARDAPNKKIRMTYKAWISDENLENLKKWCESGLSKEEIAENIGVSYTTFVKWIKKYDDIKNIIGMSNGKKNKKTQDVLIKKRDELEKILHQLNCKCGELDNFKTNELCMLVELSLLKRAIGYDYTEERTEYTDKTGEKTVKTQKHAPPDTSAQMLWLKHFGGLSEKKEEVEPIKFDLNINIVEG